MRMTIIGIVIAVVGAVVLWVGGIPYLDQTEIIDVGPIRATAQTREMIDIPPLAGGAIMAFGVGLAVYARLRSS